MSKVTSSGIRGFLEETRYELSKCHWLSKQELIRSTWIVIVFCLLFGAFVGLSDFVLGKFINLLTGARG